MNTYACPKCQGNIQSSIELDEEEVAYSCRSCDPSTQKEKYIWDQEYNFWDLEYVIMSCRVCGKSMKVTDRYGYLELDLELELDYNDTVPGTLYTDSSETIHGYNCSVKPCHEPTPVLVHWAKIEDKVVYVSRFYKYHPTARKYM